MPPSLFSLQLTHGNQNGERIPLVRGTLTVGTRQDCDLVMGPEDQVAEHHVTFIVSDATVEIEPGQGITDLTLRGSPVTSRQQVRDGDLLTFGGVSCCLHAEAPDADATRVFADATRILPAGGAEAPADPTRVLTPGTDTGGNPAAAGASTQQTPPGPTRVLSPSAAPAAEGATRVLAPETAPAGGHASAGPSPAAKSSGGPGRSPTLIAAVCGGLVAGFLLGMLFRSLTGAPTGPGGGETRTTLVIFRSGMSAVEQHQHLKSQLKQVRDEGWTVQALVPHPAPPGGEHGTTVLLTK